MRTSYTTLILIKLESMALCYQTTKNLCWWEATFIGIERDAYGIACQIDLEDTIFIMYDNDKSITLMHSDGSFIISFKAPSKKYAHIYQTPDNLAVYAIDMGHYGLIKVMFVQFTHLTFHYVYDYEEKEIGLDVPEGSQFGGTLLDKYDYMLKHGMYDN
jgi:hypothetical protein